MTREELKEHCLKQVERCEMWAKYKSEEPSGKIYEEHKLILELLEQEPIILELLEPEPKRGHWIKKENEFIVPSKFHPIKEIISTCSICNARYIGIHENFKYCPNCGARMIESDGT